MVLVMKMMAISYRPPSVSLSSQAYTLVATGLGAAAAVEGGARAGGGVRDHRLQGQAAGGHGQADGEGRMDDDDDDDYGGAA
jgi:hypothetical protein